MLLCCSFPS